MGSFGGALEQITVEMDPRSVLAAVAQMNAAVADMEKGVAGSGDKVNRTWQTISETMTRTVDRSKNAADSYIRSLEKQAAAAGKSGLDKLNAQMEQAIKNYGYSDAAIKKITDSYEKLAKAQEKLAEAQEKGAQGFSAGTRAGMGVRDLFEGRNAYAAVELGKGLSELKGAPAILGAVAAGFVAVAAAGFELVKSAGEGARELNNLAIRTGLTVEQAENLSIQAKIAGVDISSLERSAVQLSKGLEDASGAGKKQIETLRDMGISTLQTSGQQKEMGQVLLEVLQHLSQIPDTTKRVYESQLLLGRGAKELQPMIVDMAALKETADKLAQSLDHGANEQLLKAAKQISEMDTAWEVFKKNLAARIAPIIIPVLYSFTKGDTGAGPHGLAADSRTLSDSLDLYRNGSFAPSAADTAALVKGLANSSSQAAQGEATRQRILKQQGTTQEGLEATLSNLKEQIAKDRATLNQTGAGSDAYLNAQKDLKKEDSQQLQIENQLKAVRAGQDNTFDKYMTGKLASISSKDVSPLQKVLEERDATLREVQDMYNYLPKAVVDAGTSKLTQAYTDSFNRALGEMELKSTRESQKTGEETAKIQVQMAEERLAIEREITQQNTKQAENSAKAGFFQPVAGGAEIPLTQLTQTPGMGTPPGPSSQQEAQLTKDMLAQESRRIELMAGPGGELAAARQILELKEQSLGIDEQSAIKEAQAITNEAARETKIYDIRLEYAQKIHDAEDQFQDQLLEKQKQVAQTAAGLYHTLFTQPDKFAKQLQSTIKEAALKPVTEGLGNLTAQAVTPLIYGAKGQGGIAGIFSGGFGAKSSPLGDVQSTNGAMHVFVTNPGAPGSSTPYFGSSGAPGFAGTTSVAGAPMGPIPSFGGGSPSIISVPMGVGGAISVPYFGGGRSFGGGTSFGGGGFGGGGFSPSSVSLPYFGGGGGFGGGTTLAMPYFGGSGAVSDSSTVSLPYFGASAPLFTGDTSGGIGGSFGSGSGYSGTGYQGYGGYAAATGGGSSAGGVAGNIASTALRAFAGIAAPGTGGLGNNPASAIGPGGTAGFAGPLKQVNSIGGRFAGMGANLGPAFGIGQGGMSSDNPFSDSDNPLGPQMAAGGDTTFGSVMSSQGAGAVMGAVGLPLAENGLLGNNRGTGMGILEGGIGGALEGASIGTMILPGLGTAIGAGVGAVAGALIGVGEMLAGVISPQNKVKQLVKQLYKISIGDSEANQIVKLAQQKYGSNYTIAVRSPEVRQMLGLYAAGTGQSQNSTLSSTVPHAGSLVEQGGTLFQQATYSYGTPYAYHSNLPVLGGPIAGTYPSGGSSSPTSVTLNVNGQSAADLLEGRITSTVDSTYVADAYSAANASSYQRVQNSADLSQPGLITG